MKVKKSPEDPDWSGEGGMIMDHSVVKGKFLVYMLGDQKVCEAVDGCILIMQEWLGSLYSEESNKWVINGAAKRGGHRGGRGGRY